MGRIHPNLRVIKLKVLCERIAERIFQLEARLFNEKCSYREREIAMDAVLYR
jgi:hypothetical protein